MSSYSCDYAGFNCCIRVENNQDELLKQLKSDFGYYYDIEDIADESVFDATIVITDNAFDGTVDTAKECIHSSHSRNIKYLLDGTKYTQNDASIYASKRVDGDDIYYYIKDTDTKVKMLKQQKQVYISGGNIYKTLVYVYETLLNLYIESAGGILLHAASCSWGGKGYVISGKSGGGKTSLLFGMLEDGGAFHANDRIALIRKGDKVLGYSIPIPVNVPIRVMRNRDGWKDTDLVKKAEDDTKIRFEVGELEQLFQNSMQKELVITNIINVKYNDQEPGYQQIDKSKLVDFVELLSPYDENHPKWLPLFEYPDEKEVERRLLDIGKQIKADCVYGCDTFAALQKAE